MMFNLNHGPHNKFHIRAKGLIICQTKGANSIRVQVGLALCQNKWISSLLGKNGSLRDSSREEVNAL